MTDTPQINTAMNGETLDIAEQRRRELKQLFPSAFTETYNAQGELVHAVDFERLKAELGSFSEFYEGKKERYSMDWPGKRDCLKLIQTPSRATLKPCREESVDFDTTQNLFIEGDNLEVLKLLQKSYYGKVKMIYIDPPYNTGNEFIYPDNYAESLDTYLAYAGLVDDKGKKFSTNTANEGRFHSKWLNMMYPRLYLARNLLREDGVIFISIDDNEVENLRRMCDEIFGEENFISQLCWKKSYGGGSKSRWVVGLHEYIVVYSKNKESIERIELPPRQDVMKYYKYQDDKYELRGPYRRQPLATNSMDDRENLKFSIVYKGEEIWPEKQWQWSKDRVESALKNDELVFTKRGDKWTVDYKQYLKNEDGEIRGAKPFSVLDGPYTQTGTSEIEEHFGSGKIFNFPKPTALIQSLIDYCGTEGIIVDFFAGSSATAEACFKKNLVSGSSFNFLVVQLPERCASDSEAFLSGYKTIADLSKDRIRKSGNKINLELEGQLDLEEKHNIDLGFKVLKLDQSNIKQWQPPTKEIDDAQLKEQLALQVDHIDAEATQEDILYELLLKAGITPTERIEKIELANHNVFSIADGGLLICLEENIDRALIDAVLAHQPAQFICLDRAFHGNDQLKANAVAMFAAHNKGNDGSDTIEFRTV
jgi:adenine-specific DNA-methyltransferase